MKNSDNLGKDFDRTYYLLVMIFSLILFYICVMTRHTSDYPVHSLSMERIPLRPLLNPLNWYSWFDEHGYPLWHISGHIIMRLLNCPREWAAGINSGGWCVLSYLGALKTVEYLTKSAEKRVVAILTFVLFIVAPVWLPWINERIILGVGGTNVWHNATNICGRAVGIFAFYYAMKLLDDMVESGYTYIPPFKRGICLSLLFVLSLLAKPSFAQTFVPAFAILLLFYLIKSKGAFFREFLCFAAIAILPVLKLGMQFLHYFGTSPGDEGLITSISGEGIIVVLPEILNVVGQYGRQLLVLLFPITMMIALLATRRGLDKYHAIAWMMVEIGLIYVLTLKGAATGEMGWAYYIASFMAYMIGIRDYASLFYSGQSNNLGKRMDKVLYVVSTIALVEQAIVGVFYLYELIILGKTIF